MKPNLLMTIILPFFLVMPAKHRRFSKLAGVLITDTTVSKQDNPYPSIGDIPVPGNYSRIEVEKKSFAQWLRRISLKKSKTIHLYDGSVKADQSAQFAVLNISVGNQDLQQCADAVMRLRAEFLYAQKRFGEIVFRDNNNSKYAFGTNEDRNHFNKYLDRVFSYCGTISLERQLNQVRDTKDIKIGDVLISGGSPGHAMLVADMAINSQGKRIYLLAQGYMPAQDIHIVVNPSDAALSPWYEMNNKEVDTPGWSFRRGHFKTW